MNERNHIEIDAGVFSFQIKLVETSSISRHDYFAEYLGFKGVK
jgi:hypothetical protein